MLEIGTNSMNEFEEQTHFSFWAALKSPLIIGADITNISESSLSILLNKEIIAISQDELGVAACYVPELSTEHSVQIWGGPLAHKYVALALNEANSTTNINLTLNKLPGLETSCNGTAVSVRDVWSEKELGVFTGEIPLQDVAPHQTKVLVMTCT